MEIDYRLNRTQENALTELNRDDASWALRRYQGTGLKFWRITLNNGPEWNGAETHDIDGRTLDEAIQGAVRILRLWKL